MHKPLVKRWGRFGRVRRRGALRRGAALLEVVLSVSILLLGMGFVGMAFRNGSLYVERAERTSRATQLTERLLGQMSSGLTVVGEQEMTGSFGDESMPGMCWRAVASASEQSAGLINITIDIFMGSPEDKPESREVVMTTYAQQASFVPLNMQRDFGMTPEQLELMTQSIPGGAAVFDPTSFDPRTIARMDMGMLTQLLPLLIQAFGGQVVAEHLDDVMKAVQTGDVGALQGLAQQAQQEAQQQGQTGSQQPGGPPHQPNNSSNGSSGPRQGNDQTKKPQSGGKK